MESTKLSKAEQARINGAKSSGPKTPEGLDRCRQASAKHGLWAAHVSTFSHEEQMQYAAILTSATGQFHPRNCVESAVVGLLADALWRAGRLGGLANLDIKREMWVINSQTTTSHDPIELHLLAEQASKSVARLEARGRHYTREVARLMEILRKLQTWPVSVEASQMLNEVLDLTTQEVPPPTPKPATKPAPPPPAAPEPQPARKPVQTNENLPRKGSVPRRR